MIKVLRSRQWTFAGVSIVILLFIGLIIYGAQNYLKLDTTISRTVFLEGEYSVDGGEWKPTNGYDPINERFHKITFKGKMSDFTAIISENITISSQNVWYTTKTSDGKPVFELTYLGKEELRQLYISSADDPNDPMLEPENFDKMYSEGYASKVSLPDSPGYKTTTSSNATLNADGKLGEKEFVLEVVNPYPFAEQSFNDCFKVMFSEANGVYLKFFFDVFPPVLAFLLVCFFGIFLFPIAGFILGKINYQYFAFGALCFFWGMFMIGQRASTYLNMWILDPAACMTIVILLRYCLFITIMFYLKSNLKGNAARAAANLVATIYILATAAAIVLQFTNVSDLYATSSVMYLFAAAGTLVITVLLIAETRHNPRAVMIIISWTPLTLSVLLDALNRYLLFTNIHFYYFGLAITMIYQIIRLVYDLRKQYLESIRYQQMQKELYEAKVGVMVSQIQPHFMYNALTSIAMMCSIDPETAQEATVTFAKYLRGNMDSLKQTNPVPFTQELAHLKKYLYIEKLRFGNKLNVEYDIQPTDFVLPQLSIQPIVENAVKHGVGMKKKGGTVTIATRETDNAYEVIVSDDGVGFDTTAQKKDDGRSHVGMENTRRRLKDMCFGNFDVFLPDGTPVHFERSRSKEIFAYLVHRHGSSCSTREIAAALFEDEPYDNNQQSYVQTLISAMMKSLKKVGAQKAVNKSYNALSVNPAVLDCDYYRFAELDAGAVNAYANEYMSQYYWADFMFNDF